MAKVFFVRDAKTEQRDDAKRIDFLQVLRAGAAAMIVCLHADVIFDLLPHQVARKLGAGVDLFFVISGFVMVYASQRFFGSSDGWRTFMTLRIVRVVPLYWLALSLRLILLASAVIVMGKEFPEFGAIITSYLFIPYDAHGYGKEFPFPILDVGWTLNYEMFFYIIFSFFLFLPILMSVFLVSFALTFGVTVNVFLELPLPFDFWLRPIVLEFVAGMWIGFAFVKGWRLHRVPGTLAIVAGIFVWAAMDIGFFHNQVGPGDYSFGRLIVFGGGAILIVAGATLTGFGQLPPRLQILARLGDSSYALYLMHPFVLAIVRPSHSHFTQISFLQWPFFLIVLALTIAAAHAVHLYIECPLNKFLRKKFVATNSMTQIPAGLSVKVINRPTRSKKG